MAPVSSFINGQKIQCLGSCNAQKCRGNLESSAETETYGEKTSRGRPRKRQLDVVGKK